MAANLRWRTVPENQSRDIFRVESGLAKGDREERDSKLAIVDWERGLTIVLWVTTWSDVAGHWLPALAAVLDMAATGLCRSGDCWWKRRAGILDSRAVDFLAEGLDGLR